MADNDRIIKRWFIEFILGYRVQLSCFLLFNITATMTDENIYHELTVKKKKSYKQRFIILNNKYEKKGTVK